MTEWTWWAALLVGIAVSLFLANFKANKKHEDEHRAQTAEHETRLTRLESTNMTERDVRSVLKDFFLPFMTGIQEVQRELQGVQKELQATKIEVAKLSKDKD